MYEQVANTVVEWSWPELAWMEDELACKRKAVSLYFRSAYGFATLYTVPCIYQMQILNDNIATSKKVSWLLLHESRDALMNDPPLRRYFLIQDELQ